MNADESSADPIWRMFLRQAALAIGLAMFGAAPVVAAPEPLERPNILFILTDDQGWSSLGCYGNRIVPTRYLDQLAAAGVQFTAAYAMPQCTPTRAALMTGQHTARTRMWHVLTKPWYGYPWAPVQEPPYREGLPRTWHTLPKGLRAAGYATGMAGKWHLTANEDGDYTALRPAAADAYGFDYVAPRGPGDINSGDKWVDHLTDEAISFIRNHRDRRWFFYLAHHTLHGEVSAPEELVAKHRKQGAPEQGLNNATYLAAIEHLDRSVGRLLAALDDLGLRKRTLVVFMSDNGGVSHSYDPRPFTDGPGVETQLTVAKREFSNAPLRGPKGSPYEGGIRVPCVVRWPDVISPAQVINTPIHVVDWLPTLWAAAQVDSPSDLQQDGVSLLPLLRGGTLPERSLFWHVPLYDLRWAATPCAVVRRGDWKLIEYFGDRYDAHDRYTPGHHVELYHLGRDPGEATDVAAGEPERTRSLLAELHAFLRDCQAEVPGPNPHYDAARPFKETSDKPAFLRQPPP
ncbi:MAG: sulfatase [Pirellulaceae bacterium]